jgi:very-short-patch-repair endonuclease
MKKIGVNIRYKFRRQQPIGRDIVDFVCLEKRLVIEVDGSQHSEQVTYDLKRDTWLEKQGFFIRNTLAV